MPKTDLRYRRWNNPKAEQKAVKEQLKQRAVYLERRNHLVEMIENTVMHNELPYYLTAPTVDFMLLALKHEIDLRPGGLYARRPYAECAGDSPHEQGERAKFMKEAFTLALTRGKIKLDKHGDEYLLRPRAVIHRNGKVVSDYAPTDAELAVYRIEDSEPEQERTLSGKYRALCRKWQQ
ncbi:MAG: hypothetical protein JWM07_912 [Candidatus Saccharibacteria bacterium]|jgi:hypothetical protein|nr:hypothetical protein [Candidatus Saccharibacteria bacterium]